jgi:uncharacterized protein YbjT (DUF2867 family)
MGASPGTRAARVIGAERAEPLRIEAVDGVLAREPDDLGLAGPHGIEQPSLDWRLTLACRELPESDSPWGYSSEDSRCDPADTVGVGDRIDLDDLALGDGETHHGKGPSTHGDDHSRCSVHQRWVHPGSRHRAYECLPGDGRCAADHIRSCGAPGAKVGSQHHVGIEQGEEGVEIAATREESVDHRSLTSEVGIRNRYVGAPHAASCPARQLSRRRRGAADHGCDLLERQLEHVLEDERQPLGRGQGVKHDEKSKADRIGQHRLFLRLELALWAYDGVGQAHPEGFLPSNVARTQHVQTHAGDDRRQPTGHNEPGVRFVVGDLLSGTGVDAAVDGVATIIHCAGSNKGDEIATQTLVSAAARARQPHFVYISVVGADRIPVTGRIDRMLFSYFDMKRKAEEVVAGSGLPWTTIRATQFHDLIFMVVEKLAKLPVVPVPAGVAFQPVDADEVAARLVELAFGRPAGLVPDIAGPRAYGAAELIRGFLDATHRRRILLPLWLPGKAARALRAGANLAPEQAVGHRTWEDFLTERVGT